jgi:hypothetical protein
MVGSRLAPVVWWHDTPDGRELKIAADGREWQVLIEGDEREYCGRDLRLVLADAVDAAATAPWLVALADQIEAAATGLPR